MSRRFGEGVVLLLVCATVLGLGCGSEPPADLRLHGPSAGLGGACATNPGEPHVGRFGFVGRSNLSDGIGLGSAVGLAALPVGLIAYDAWTGTVGAITLDFTEVWRFGRTGDGPGEFRRGMMGNFAHITHNWLYSRGDTIAVIDGRRLSLFDTAGTPHNTFNLPAGALLSTPRLYAVVPSVKGPLLVWTNVLAGRFARRGVEDADLEGARMLRVTLLEKTGNRDLFQVSLPALPKMRRPGFDRPGSFEPAHQAKPLVATSGDCLIISDGATDQLLLIDVGAGSVDTVSFVPQPPEIPIPRVTREQLEFTARFQGVSVEDLPEPTAIMRWTSLTVDPSGWVWLRPWTAEKGGAVDAHLVNPLSGETRRISVSDFPDLFTGPREYIALFYDSPTGLRGFSVYRADPP